MDSRLRILVVLPLYGGSLPVGRFAATALRRMGQVVDLFEAPDFYGSYQGLNALNVSADRLEYLQNSYLQVVSQAVLAKVETFEPDLVLALAQAPLSRQALKRLRREGISTAMWFVEDFRLFTYWQAFAPLYDVFAVIQKEPFFSELAKIGQENALYLPMAADPEFHKPAELTPVERKKWGSRISFMGAGYPNRRVAFRELTDLGLAIWGNEWDGDPVLEPLNRLQGKRLTPEECVKVFNATEVNLNLHSGMRADKPVPGGDFVNPRTFELASCGAFQLVDERELLRESFCPTEVESFRDMAELREKIIHFLAEPGKREAQAALARQRVLAEHTYEHRMAALLDFARERLGGRLAAVKQEPSAWEALPQASQQELAALLDRLGLPHDVSFPDLVAALRREQGVLGELDTAILFLDEWRKQYKVEL